MGRVYEPPDECGTPPEWNSTTQIDDIRASEQAYTQRIVDWCKAHGKGPEAGEIITFPVADGQAIYVIESLKPLILIHVPIGDAYDFLYIERLTAKDIREQLKRIASIKQMFSKPQGATS